MRTLIALIFSLFCAASYAQGWNSAMPAVGTQVAPRTTTFSPGPQLSELLDGAYRPKAPASLLDDLLRGRVYVPGPAGSGNGTFIDGLRAPGPGPAGAFDAQVKRSILWPATAKAASRALPLIGTALIVKDLYDEIRCREKFGGGGECDDGQPAVSVAGFCTNNPAYAGSGVVIAGPICATTRELLGPLVAAAMNAQNPSWNAVYLRVEGNFVIIRIFVGFTVETSAASSPQTVLSCPPVGGSVPTRGRDGLCPTGEYAGADYPEIEQKIRDFGDKARAPFLWEPLSEAGIPFDHPTPDIDGPGAIQGGRETLTRPDGTTRTRDTDHPMDYGPGEARWEDRTTEREWGSGVTPTPPGTPPGEGTPPGTTTTGAPAPAPIEVITCGLPGKPPCKIDESGTPTGQGAADGPSAALDGLRDSQVGLITSGQVSALPWLWAFSLPQGACSPYVWVVQGHTITIDICNTWLVEFWRAFLGWAYAGWAALYIWRTTTRATGGT